ncbi:uncharacterized protein GVI51_L04675 [Nakaseomyces glabratus]|uniref:Uncharacterized protein n=1 Tax=Candida glabrata (strain ATCC 2001 / BCRC 20586 / JCM 3761 / NBRC 0622 / NRRL Y-65 / CBS 138) TaxID=284593 RepID=B4UN46_CANGA|nr:uncharacterized protein CAGL0L04832g [Nakaseomyces glabratus]KAH7595467.1 hypothetical protein J7294_04293 [Nakaseomyces glabratus]KAH7601899.1 hypothetical protein J7293_04286 [Nakaseomyces glabratus]QHS68656.1 uncharacterized protein GVI51_L04675 [Nakaseomyces glabratus]CAR58062.1 unnamed protein product [Nakaseomyces glabratus]|eukprot:XP_002999589.1 uncharacterized protein CAGL0L04832g [[Candida] glabrata]
MKQTHDDTQCLAYSGEDNRTIAMLLSLAFGRVPGGDFTAHLLYIVSPPRGGSPRRATKRLRHKR